MYFTTNKTVVAILTSCVHTLYEQACDPAACLIKQRMHI